MHLKTLINGFLTAISKSIVKIRLVLGNLNPKSLITLFNSRNASLYIASLFPVSNI